MAIKYDSEDNSSGRKETGRTDKYSDETPKKDYADYRVDFPNDNKAPRKQAKDISDRVNKEHFIGGKSLTARKQELTSHIQNFQESFNNQESKLWKIRFRELYEALG